MKNVYLIRQSSGKEGTFGTLLTGDMKPLRTGELRWQNNERGISCISEGSYVVRWSKSPKFGWVYYVRDVSRRSHILIHSGNYCGDMRAGLKSDVLGCIILGTRVGKLGRQKAILASRVAIKRFVRYMGTETFRLHIIGMEET